MLSYIFSKLICHPSGLDMQLLCLKFQKKTYKFLLNYSYLFWGPLFNGTQCTYYSKLTQQTNQHLKVSFGTMNSTMYFSNIPAYASNLPHIHSLECHLIITAVQLTECQCRL